MINRILNLFTKSTLYFIPVILILMGFGGCSVFDRDEPEPAYLFIDEFQLTTKSDNSQGSDAHDVRDAWVYVNAQLIGVFEVPVTIPILTTDTVLVTVLPGIIKNGLANEHTTYPFYKSVSDSMILRSGVVDSVFPKLTYHDSTEFVWIEDFEDRTISLERSGTNVQEDSIRLTFDPSEVFNYSNKNQVSGYVEFDSANQKFENSTIGKFKIPNNTICYFEINYNLETLTQVGFYAYDDAGVQLDKVPLLTLKPTDNSWKKTYISLTEDINNPKFNDASIKIYFEAYGSDSIPNSRIYIDNLKLLHF